MDSTDATHDVNAIRSVFESWYRAMEDGDVAELLGLVTNDVIVKAPGSPAVEGQSALEHALSAFFEACCETVVYNVEEVEVCGELAFARVLECATILAKSGADASSMSGMHLTILRRQSDGEWLIARDVSSLLSDKNNNTEDTDNDCN
jgi:uncharacterized protein (TIGR02246 family)